MHIQFIRLLNDIFQLLFVFLDWNILNDNKKQHRSSTKPLFLALIVLCCTELTALRKLHDEWAEYSD